VSGAPVTLDAFLLSTNYTMIYSNIEQFFIDFDALSRFGATSGRVTQTRSDSRQSDWNAIEEVGALYALGRHAGPRHTVIFGGRFEDTQTEVERGRTVGSGATAVISRVTRKGGYDHFLPSITANYDFTDNLRLRAAAFRAVGRPNPFQLASGETVNQTTGAINRGNPALKAREGDSYEASLEYYFPGNEGLLAIGVFRKEIDNEIITRLTVGGGPGGVDITQPINVTSAEVTGLELSAVVNNLPTLGLLENLPFLSNFSFSANATFIDGAFDTGGTRGRVNELQGQSDFLFNFALFYEQGPFRARAAYAHIGEAKTSVSSTDPLQDRIDKATNTVDTQARWAINNHIELIGEIRNLTNEAKVNYTGARIYRDVSFYGRQLWLGTTFKF
jgi:TonB-dependent receptor